ARGKPVEIFTSWKTSAISLRRRSAWVALEVRPEPRVVRRRLLASRSGPHARGSRGWPAPGTFAWRRCTMGRSPYCASHADRAARRRRCWLRLEELENRLAPAAPVLGPIADLQAAYSATTASVTFSASDADRALSAPGSFAVSVKT